MPLSQRDSYAFFAARSLVCLLVCLLPPFEARAQSTSAHLEGTVQDQTGAPVESAEVTLKNKSSVVSEGKTDADGRFKLDATAIQGATLSISARGFAPFERELAALQQ